MNKLKVTTEFLNKVGKAGKYLAVRLKHDHIQKMCIPVPVGTVGIIISSWPTDVGRQHVFCFPHSVLNEKIKTFREGDIRILSKNDFEPIGRVG